jgi:hypothetical protein
MDRHKCEGHAQGSHVPGGLLGEQVGGQSAADGGAAQGLCGEVSSVRSLTCLSYLELLLQNDINGQLLLQTRTTLTATRSFNSSKSNSRWEEGNICLANCVLFVDANNTFVVSQILYEVVDYNVATPSFYTTIRLQLLRSTMIM